MCLTMNGVRPTNGHGIREHEMDTVTNGWTRMLYSQINAFNIAMEHAIKYQFQDDLPLIYTFSFLATFNDYAAMLDYQRVVLHSNPRNDGRSQEVNHSIPFGRQTWPWKVTH